MCDQPLGKVAVSHEGYSLPSNVHVMPHTWQIKRLHTIIRDQTTSRTDFIFYSDRLIRLLVEECLQFLPHKEKVVTTPTGAQYVGCEFNGKLCGVSIVRAGESMENALRQMCMGIRIGKILIQRDEETAQPKLFYDKLPEDIANRFVLLLDPMLATGGSCMMAIDVLKEKGVPEDHIIFMNLISSMEGILEVAKRYPHVRIVTSEIDLEMNTQKYIIPGIGDFGDLYFGTDPLQGKRGSIPAVPHLRNRKESSARI